MGDRPAAGVDTMKDPMMRSRNGSRKYGADAPLRGAALVALAFLMAIWSSSAMAVSTVAPGTKLWSVISPDPALRDAPEDVVVSPNGGKVFVVGSYDDGGGGHSAYETRAYDAATGRELWARTFTGTGNVGGARSAAISPDGSRLYVTGSTQDRDGGYAFTTLAYATRTGARLWLAEQRSVGLPDYGGGPEMVMSPDGSRVYVTGSVEDPVHAGAVNALTIAYDPTDGSRIWRTRYYGGGVGTSANAIAVGPAGRRVYVTGMRIPPATNADFGTIAYDSSTGTRLWVGTYDDPAHDWDSPTAVTVDPRGSRVYVTGFTDSGNPGGTDYATVAYTASGVRLWAARYDGPAGSDDITAASLAVSPDGSRLFITGESTGSPTVGWATIAYATSSGSRLWLARYEGPVHAGGGAQALVLRPDGLALYVIGYTIDGDGNAVTATRAYSAATGTSLWTSLYAGHRLGILPRAIAVGPGGARVFVASAVDVGMFGDLEVDRDFGTVAYAT
jgi:hypothetical protein